jgi:hypothetical protein
MQAMYRYAIKLGLKNSYNEQNGIVKKIVRMMTGIALLHPLQAAEGFDVKIALVFHLILCIVYTFNFPPPRGGGVVKSARQT